MQNKEFWETVYQNKPYESVSWFQEHAEISLRLIRSIGVEREASILDVGGGASTLVDDLLNDGFNNIFVLDLSLTALNKAKSRLDSRAGTVNWIDADVISTILMPAHYDIWHDRAVFHFLTTTEERLDYIKQVRHSVKLGGHIIIATFAEDGPTQCSGLPVMRYTAEELHAEFGASFELVGHLKDSHLTPSGNTQQFVYCHFKLTS